ncbi:hypothetical protein [Chondromyces crocatus]|uniref:Uncharacterized protein n=1 Tax=Chondromyces crocatus TaxID=52 RepID=A0A0K1EBJ0_CHOCO|nr:hypothetical protein [Chondromyces crocatus]AKT38251.1 uncharacterized protein CMC5_023940 [Chondromyces crocatus]
MLNPLRNPEAFDVWFLAGQVSPGLSEVAGASSPRKWDERQGYGLSGATIVYTGDGLAQFAIKVFLWEDEHFEQWAAFKVLLKKAPSGTRPKALDIYHPILEDLEISSVVVEDRSQLTEVQGEPGMFFVEVKFKQHRAPTPAIGKPTGSQSKPTAEDAFDKTIEKLTKQFQELAG